MPFTTRAKFSMVRTSLPTTPANRASTPVGDYRMNQSEVLKGITVKLRMRSALHRDDGTDRSRHHKWVKRHFRDKIYWGCDPVQLINAVWRLGWHEIVPNRYHAHPNASTQAVASYELLKQHLQDYMRVDTELGSHLSLVEMANNLLEQLYGPQRGAEDRPVRKLQARLRVRSCKSLSESEYADEKANQGFSAETESAEARRSYEVAFLEVKRTYHKAHCNVPVNIVPEASGPLASTGKRRRAADDGEDESGGGGEARLSKRPCLRLTEETKQIEGTDADGHEATPEDEAPGVATDGSAQPVGRELTNKEAQMVKYMNNLMSSNVRSYGVGWLIENETMRLWYGDRMGLIVTERFNFLGVDKQLFLLAVAATGNADLHDMGIFPDLYFPEKCMPAETELEQYRGAQFRLDACLPGEDDVRPFEFDVDECDGARVYTEFGVIGRGTTVVPVKATQGTQTCIQEWKDEKLVAKIGWPHRLCKAEDTLIVNVRRRLQEQKPAYLRHIVDLKCSITRTMDEMNLPRVAMGIRPEEMDERVCRTLILKRYQRLEEVGDVENFKTVYVHVVRAHYWVWTTSRILHRDISTNNLMWYRNGDEIIGVLCDWDLAEENTGGRIHSTRAGESPAAEPPSAVAAQGEEAADRASVSEVNSNDETMKPRYETMKPRYRTGTGPFMAMDLLRAGPTPFHLYRHDLESFFYLLAYVCAVYNPVTKKFGHLVDWEHEALIYIGSHKLGWVPQLCSHFNRIEYRSSSISWLRSQVGLGNALDKKEIEMHERFLEKEITYERFMDILGAPYDC